MPVSIRDVAQRAGVSRATVSKVLNFKTQSEIAVQTQQRVRTAALELGYHPRAVARGLAGMHMNTLGVVLAYDLPSVTADPYLGPVLDGIFDVNKRRRQKTVIFTEDDWETAFENLPVYCDGHCDGLILIAPLVDSAIVLALMGKETPFLLLGDSREAPGVCAVDIDNEQVGRVAVRHLLELGHRHIGVFCGNAAFLSSYQRLEGYRSALGEYDLMLDPGLIWPGEYWEWSGERNAVDLLTRPRASWPTALFCQDDRIAVGAIRSLKAAGVRIPEEISVVGVSDYTAAALNDPPITTVHFPLRRVGETAVEMLLERIHEGIAPGQRRLLTGELVVRASAGPPASRG